MKYKYIVLLFLNFLILLPSCEKEVNTPSGNIAINEILPVNTTIVQDQNGEYDDWIELFNLTSSDIDISGYNLSDKKSNIRKWQFPQGTIIQGNGYLIIWADSDTTQSGLHANFKLSSAGERVILSKPDGIIIDEVTYSAQNLELSYARNPDGTGPFKWQTPTFNRTNSE
jgi:hypothetical protein